MSDKEAKRLRRPQPVAWEPLLSLRMNNFSHRFLIMSPGKSSTNGGMFHIYVSLKDGKATKLTSLKKNETQATKTPNHSTYIDKTRSYTEIMCNHSSNQLDIYLICYRVSNIGYVAVIPIVGWVKARPHHAITMMLCRGTNHARWKSSKSITCCWDQHTSPLITYMYVYDDQPRFHITHLLRCSILNLQRVIEHSLSLPVIRVIDGFNISIQNGRLKACSSDVLFHFGGSWTVPPSRPIFNR